MNQNQLSAAVRALTPRPHVPQRQTPAAEILARTLPPVTKRVTGVPMISPIDTHQDAPADEKLMRARLEHYPWPREDTQD